MAATTFRDGVLVVGGGYAGLHAARAAERAGAAVTVVDATGQHDFVTRLAAVAGGTAPESDARRPLSRFVRRVETGVVVDMGDGRVELADGRTLAADAVVVTAGAEASRPPIEGIEHASTLRTADDALVLRRQLASSDGVVIVGGGATGVQLAGALAHAHPGTEIHLVEADERLLSTLPAGLGSGAARILRDRGVHVHLGRSVERIGPSHVDLEDQSLAGVVVWAGGFAANAERLGVPTGVDGRVVVDADLRVDGMERTFAAGDVAAHVDDRGRALPMSAQIAVRAGTVAGRNAALVASGRSADAAHLSQLGWVLDLGGRRGLAQIGPLVLGGPGLDLLPPLLHDAIDLKNLVEIGGLGALRDAPSSVASLLPRLPGPGGAVGRFVVSST